MYDTFTAWDADLRSAGSVLMQAIYDSSNLSKSWPLNTADTATVRADINAGNAGLPPWYLKEIASGATNSISLPISDANFSKVQAEWVRRHSIWVDLFKSKWGS